VETETLDGGATHMAGIAKKKLINPKPKDASNVDISEKPLWTKTTEEYCDPQTSNRFFPISFGSGTHIGDRVDCAPDRGFSVYHRVIRLTMALTATELLHAHD
jgi:hypothetical protein